MLKAVWIPSGPFWKRWWYRLKPPREPAGFVPVVGPPPWAGPPESEIGVAVPVRATLHSTPDLVIALIDLVAFSNGFEFRIALRSKNSIEPRSMGFGPPGGHHESLEVEIGFADGRSGKSPASQPSVEVLNYYQEAREGREPELPAGPVIGLGSGGGGGRRWDFQWWVWPLPPDGPVTLLCRWPAGKIVTKSLELDGAAIRRAGAESKDLWKGE
jgi:hypothetical protein